MARYCAACGGDLPVGLRTDAVCCSASCRKRLERMRIKGVTKRDSYGYMGVTDNPKASPTPPPPRAAQSAPDAKYPIPDDLSIPSWLRRDPGAPHWKLIDEGAL
jgi:hypothetical protein